MGMQKFCFQPPIYKTEEIAIKNPFDLLLFYIYKNKLQPST